MLSWYKKFLQFLYKHLVCFIFTGGSFESVTTLDKVDVVTVGVGWTGGIIAAEASKEGLTVVGLERGKNYETSDYQHVHDELKYSIRYELMQDISKDTLTFRNEPDQQALPMRQLGFFFMGDGLGGAGKH